MRHVLMAAAAMMIFCACAQFTKADDQKEAPVPQKLTGVLIDQMCGKKMMKEQDPTHAAEAHTAACCVKCGKSGYAIIADQKLIKFDANGDKLAKQFLADTKDKSNLKVNVEGTVTGDQIAVTSLTPAASEEEKAK